MTEKIGLIKNPLTIIAIFAGIAEVSGTIVLPFVSPDNQRLFIWFLILFPSGLVLIFFLILVAKNHVLYAPSDYQNESNYVRINHYDKSELRNVEVKVDKIDLLEETMKKVLMKVSEYKNVNAQLLLRDVTPDINGRYNPFSDRNESKYLVAKFSNAIEFIDFMAKKAIYFNLYISHKDALEYLNLEEHASIWLGIKVKIDVAKRIILLAKDFYPHLKYIHLAEEEGMGDDEIFIGGSTSVAINRLHMKPMKNSDFNVLEGFQDAENLHAYIRGFFYQSAQ